MSERFERASAAAARLRPRWDEQHTERSLDRLHASIRRRMAAKIIAGSMLAVAVILGGVSTLTMRSVALPTTSVVSLTDGTTVTPLTPSTEILTAEVTPETAVIRLRSGAAHFSVVHGRRFQVDAGPVQVRVLGTEFDVRHEGERVAVEVRRGRVAVSWATGEATLTAGEQGLFPPTTATTPPTPPEPALPPAPIAEEPPAPAPAPPPQSPPPSPPRSPSPSPSRRPPPPSTDWKELARQGAFQPAYDQMKAEDPKSIDTMEELLLAADVARLSGHPAEAVPHLRRALAHEGEPRLPIAAFTLGRVLLEELGEPGAAAEAFARSRALAPDGPLAEDALAREVEAWSRAGSADLAHQRALDYKASYPNGRRLRAVSRFGRLE